MYFMAEFPIIYVAFIKECNTPFLSELTPAPATMGNSADKGLNENLRRNHELMAESQRIGVSRKETCVQRRHV